MFGNKNNVGYCSWVSLNFAFQTDGKGKQVGAASCGCTMLHCSVNSAACLHCRTVHFNEQFFLFEKPVQLIDFTRTVHVNMNNNFFCFFKKLV